MFVHFIFEPTFTLERLQIIFKFYKSQNTMKKIFTFGMALILALTANLSFGQTTALNFNREDCNGNMQHLFADLDAGNAVIIEFFMQNCGSCITAGNRLESMKSNLLAQYPGKIKSYAIGFNNTYSCASNVNWVTTNNFTSIPMDSGAVQVAYYGGMGMPTIVILGGGSSHSVLGTPYVGFTTSDTSTMAADIRAFLNPASGIDDINSFAKAVTIFPNPTSDLVNVSFEVKTSGKLAIDILDITGKQVSSIFNESISSGAFTKSFSSSTLANGYYLIRVSYNGNTTNYPLNIAH